MGKKYLFCLALVVIAALYPFRVSAAAPEVSAKAAVLVNADDGEVLYEKDGRRHLAIASTTKIMTALLTLEAAESSDREVSITPEMVRVEGSSMGLQAGNRLLLSGLAAGMLTTSGNDAANSAAIAVGGSAAGFAELMNRKAASLGMNDTHFVTPSGLDDEEHYSSACDMAVLARAALQNSAFAAIVRQKSVRVAFSSPDEIHTYSNHNRLLSLFPDCTGIKTGFTKKAGRCLVSSAERSGVRLIAVTLNDPNDWSDHEALFNYGFTRLKSFAPDDTPFQLDVPVVGGKATSVAVRGTKAGSVSVNSDAELKRSVELPRFVYAPVQAGQVLGTVRYDCGGKTVARTDLLAETGVERAELPKSWFCVFLDAVRRLLFG